MGWTSIIVCVVSLPHTLTIFYLSILFNNLEKDFITQFNIPSCVFITFILWCERRVLLWSSLVCKVNIFIIYLLYLLFQPHYINKKKNFIDLQSLLWLDLFLNWFKSAQFWEVFLVPRERFLTINYFFCEYKGLVSQRMKHLESYLFW